MLFLFIKTWSALYHGDPRIHPTDLLNLNRSQNHQWRGTLVRSEDTVRSVLSKKTDNGLEPQVWLVSASVWGSDTLLPPWANYSTATSRRHHRDKSPVRQFYYGPANLGSQCGTIQMDIGVWVWEDWEEFRAGGTAAGELDLLPLQPLLSRPGSDTTHKSKDFL